jgi:hypothetical protein
LATDPIPVKTPEALAELGSRQRQLSQRQRTVLLLVDGKRSAPQVRQMAQQAGAPDSCFDELLAMGMIALPGLAEAPPVEPVLATLPQDVPGPPASALVTPAPEPALGTPAALVSDASAPPDSVLSVLPPSLSLQPESLLGDSVLNEPPPSGMAALDALGPGGKDEPMEEARAIMIRAVRSEAPVAGSLTLMRLRRARSREDLEALLQEVELRITKPFKGLWASQTMSRVREILSTQAIT